MGNLKLLINFVKKFLGTVKFWNDQIAPILGYRDLVQGAIMIKRVYYVKGMNHNLFSVGQFCDADLEVAFRKSTCYIRDLKGNDLLTDYTSLFRKTESMKEALEIRLDMSTAYHPQTDDQNEHNIQTLEDMLRAVTCASFEALYGKKRHSPIMWAEVGEGQLIGPELVQETTEKISQINDRLKAALDHPKSYADKRRKPLEFSVGDYVYLKVSP
uniref:Putative reverse transcriptase domain-containing protein n=1 Tax=Tanacetum cinerariifolium TaxID=118510 RepID=A0A699HTD0_TANCI|nr:putative reverse transcriptase domain-containing protein [Tanacetum cinerariifolium]